MSQGIRWGSGGGGEKWGAPWKKGGKENLPKREWKKEGRHKRKKKRHKPGVALSVKNAVLEAIP